MCKLFFNLFKKSKPASTELPGSNEEPAYKRMNADELNRRSSRWISVHTTYHHGCYMNINDVAAILNLSKDEIIQKCPFVRNSVGLKGDLATDGLTLGVDFGLDMQQIEQVAKFFGIEDNDGINKLKQTYKVALHNAYMD